MLFAKTHKQGPNNGVKIGVFPMKRGDVKLRTNLMEY